MWEELCFGCLNGSAELTSAISRVRDCSRSSIKSKHGLWCKLLAFPLIMERLHRA
jgi:hypothetical protein